jgi:hypothetical protein
VVGSEIRFQAERPSVGSNVGGTARFARVATAQPFQVLSGSMVKLQRDEPSVGVFEPLAG